VQEIVVMNKHQQDVQFYHHLVGKLWLLQTKISVYKAV